jgi:N-acetylmuramoyl-L-alanine amidase CwlA
MNKDIKKFIKIYNESCKKDVAEKTLENSTELTDENTENIQNESFGKWMKHLVVKGKSARNKELKNTILAVLKKFNFQQAETEEGDIDRTLYQKGQGKYDIYIQIDRQLFVKNRKKTYPKCDLTITVKNAKTKNDVGTDVVKANHSWTQEELINELNNALQSICDIELSSAYRQITKARTNNETDSELIRQGKDGKDRT